MPGLHLALLHELKREMIVPRKTVWPLREVVVAVLLCRDLPLIGAETLAFLRDVYGPPSRKPNR